MNRTAPLIALAAFCGLALILSPTTPAQLPDPAEEADPELQAAMSVRRTSPEFRQLLAARDAAELDYEAAVASIPQVQAIDEEIARLRDRIRALLRLRQATIDANAQALSPYQETQELAQLRVLTADPVRQLHEQRVQEAITSSTPATP